MMTVANTYVFTKTQIFSILLYVLELDSALSLLILNSFPSTLYDISYTNKLGTCVCYTSFYVFLDLVSTSLQIISLETNIVIIQPAQCKILASNLAQNLLHSFTSFCSSPCDNESNGQSGKLPTVKELMLHVVMVSEQ